MAAIEPSPGPRWFDASRTSYDVFGNVLFRWGAGNRCARVDYDDAYQQLPEQEIVYVGASRRVPTPASARADKPAPRSLGA